jgi:hypothetical protein
MPRKVTDKIVSSFLSGKPARMANTSTDGNNLYLHGNKIAKIENGDLWVSNAGWFSNTTKERLNGIPGVSVFQKQGRWYLNGAEWDGKWINVGKVPANEQTIREEANDTGEVTKENSVDYIIQYEQGDLDDSQTLSLFSYLVKTGMAWQLQGSYGRMAQNLISQGYLDKKGTILKGIEERVVRENRRRVRNLIRTIIKEEVIKALSKKKLKTEAVIKEAGDSGYSIVYYATVGQHGDTGKSYPDYKSALRDAIKNSEDKDFMEGLEYLGVEPFGSENKFAILYIEERYLNRVANYIEGEKNKQIWKSVAQKVLQGQEKSGGKLVVPQSGTFVDETTEIKESNTNSSPALRQYLETALWSSNDEDGEPLDSNYSIEDISPESVNKSKNELADFLKKAKKWLPKDVDITSVAHDFWMSRNGHGSGFFDADYVDGQPRKMLQTIAGTFRNVDPVVGDDGKIHFE